MNMVEQVVRDEKRVVNKNGDNGKFMTQWSSLFLIWTGLSR